MSVIRTTTGHFIGDFTPQDQLDLNALKATMPFHDIIVTYNHAACQTVITFVGPSILFKEPRVKEWLDKLSFIEDSYAVTPDPGVKETDFHLEERNGDNTILRVVMDNGRKLRNPIHLVYLPRQKVWTLLVGKENKNYGITLSSAMSNISKYVQEEMI